MPYVEKRYSVHMKLLNCITITDGCGGSGPWGIKSNMWGGIVLRDGTDVYTSPADQNQLRRNETDQIIKCIKDKSVPDGKSKAPFMFHVTLR